MSKRKSSHRVFSRAFKVGIVRRMLAGGRPRGGVLPPLGGLGAAPGRDGGARRHPAPCAGPPSLWLSPDRSAAASRRLGGEPQKGLAHDARRQSAVPEETSLRSGDN